MNPVDPDPAAPKVKQWRFSFRWPRVFVALLLFTV
jgi:hypothetical protein